MNRILFNYEFHHIISDIILKLERSNGIKKRNVLHLTMMGVGEQRRIANSSSIYVIQIMSGFPSSEP